MQHADYDLGFGDFQLAKFDLTKNNVSTFWTQIGTIKLEDGNELKLCFILTSPIFKINFFTSSIFYHGPISDTVKCFRG